MTTPIKSTYDLQDEIPENHRELYVEKDGKYNFVGAEGYKPVQEFDVVQKSLQSERKLHKETLAQYTPWTQTFQGKTPAEIQAELERIPLLEAASEGKVSKEKMDAIVETTVKSRIQPIERERDTYKGRIGELEQVIANHENANRRRTIFDAIREGATKDGSFHDATYASPKGALMLLAEQYFTIDEATGKVVVADNVEGIAPGLDVKTALIELRTQHPYLAKNSMGGGAAGSTTTGGGPNPFRDNNMTARAKHIQANPNTWQRDMKNAGLKHQTEIYKAK